MTTANATVIEIDVTDLASIIERAQAALLPDDFRILHGIVETYLQVVKILSKRRSELRRLRRIFGFAMSEKTCDVLTPLPATDPSPKDDEHVAGEVPSAPPSSEWGDNVGDKAADTVGPPANDSAPGAIPSPPEPDLKPKPKRKGHGRVPAARYIAAVHVAVPHPSLRHGDPCLRCDKGNVYTFRRPAPIVRIRGQAPLVATCWDCDRFRCGTCGFVYSAQPPEEGRGPKYDETAISMLAILRYGSGMPFHRLDQLQRDLDTPLPASTQWDLMSEGADLIKPAYDELVRIAAQGNVIHNDDSHMRILEFMGKRRAKLLAQGKLPDPDRTGIYTTAIVSIVASIGPIALFRTSRKHAGENLAEVLDQRDEKLPPPIQMGDALTRNLPKGHVVVESLCIAHGRRKIVDEIDNYPVECRFIIERLALVYKLDDELKARGDSDDKRLLAHQETSAPLMEDIRARMQLELDDKRIEPNSDIGRAFNYFLKRWEKFTLFLRVAGAPLDNNIAERALKRTIRTRKVSMFYRSQRGADVGDLFMTLQHTAELHRENPFEYLTALLRHYKAVAANPAAWLPWNFRTALAALKGDAGTTAATGERALAA